MALNDKVLQLMKASGLSQKELAAKALITEASLSKYLSGTRTPRIDVIVKLAKALNTSVNDLLEGEDSLENPYMIVSAALARCKDQLTEEEKKKLMLFLLED